MQLHAADAAGNRSARAAQERIAKRIKVGDYVPDLRDLPEGFSRDVFHSEFGGLGGEKTSKIVDDIIGRLEACAGLR